MIPKISRNSLFLIKYLGYYGLLLFIPLILLGSLIFYVYLDVLEKEIEKNNINLVEMVQNSIDKEFSQIYSIYYQLYTNSTFSKWQILEDPIRAVEALSNYEKINDLISSSIIYLKDGKLLYTSEGTQSIESFLSKTDVFDDWDKSIFIEQLNNIEKPVIKTAINSDYGNGISNGRFVALMLPLPPESKNPDRTVMFLLDNLKLLSNMGATLAVKNEDFILLDSNKLYISSLSGSNYFEYDEFEKFINEVKPGKRISGMINIGNSNNLIYCTASNITGMYYIRILPEDQALGQLYRVRAIFFYTSLFIVILGVILILVNLFYNINPITKLMYLSERILGNTIIIDKKSPSIKNTVEKVLKSYDKMESQLNKSIPAIKEHILSKLLHGDVDNAEISDLPDKGFSLQVTSKHYFTSVIKILKPSDMDEKSIKDVIDFIEGSLVHGFEGYCKSITDSKTLVLILIVDEWKQKEIEEELITLCTMLLKNFKMETVVGVGNAYENLSDVGRSFIEANSALDYMLVQGVNSIIFWEDVSKQDFEKGVWYPKEELEKLENYMLQWNSQKIEEMVNSILSTIKDKKIPLSIAKCISYDIINIVVRGLNSINPSLEHQDNINLNIFSLTEAKTLDELLDRIISISKKINEFIQLNNEASSAQLMNVVLEYVHNHCFKNDFSVEGMAEHFSLSSVYLRKLFKKTTNSNILFYVNTLRIEKAKEFLKETDMGLADIVKNLGYFDTSSFVRKFKEETGVTPGDFRKINRIK